jgi:hypothetical protein
VAAALVLATAGCSRRDLSAAEREKSTKDASRLEPAAAFARTSATSDSGSLIDVAPKQTQSNAPASIEDILKSSPLKNQKADCATPASGQPGAVEIGTQCPTDPPPKK